MYNYRKWSSLGSKDSKLDLRLQNRIFLRLDFTPSIIRDQLTSNESANRCAYGVLRHGLVCRGSKYHRSPWRSEVGLLSTSGTFSGCRPELEGSEGTSCNNSMRFWSGYGSFVRLSLCSLNRIRIVDLRWHHGWGSRRYHRCLHQSHRAPCNIFRIEYSFRWGAQVRLLYSRRTRMARTWILSHPLYQWGKLFGGYFTKLETNALLILLVV